MSNYLTKLQTSNGNQPASQVLVASSSTISQVLHNIKTIPGLQCRTVLSKGQSAMNNANIKRDDDGPWSTENDPTDRILSKHRE